VRKWVFPVATAAFITAGNFKSIPALAFIPVDLTFLWALVVACAVVYEIVRRRVPPGVLTVAVGFALLLPSVFICATNDYGSEKIFRFFTLTLLATLAPSALIQDARDVERHVWAWCSLSAIVVASAILSPRQGSGTDPSSRGVAQVTAEGVDTIGLGSASAIVIITTVMGLAWRRIPWYVACPIGACALVTLLQSGSRGPLFSVAMAVVAGTVFARSRPKPSRVISLGGLCVVGTLGAFAAAPPSAQQRIMEVLLGRTIGTDVETRQGLYNIAIKSIDQHPFGIGWGNYQNIAFFIYRYPHDLVLEVLAEMGVFFGGLFLVWMIIHGFRARSASVDHAGGLVLALLVFMIGGASVSGDLNDNRVVFYTLGLAIVARALCARNAKSTPSEQSVN
jgi:hypothetical protein